MRTNWDNYFLSIATQVSTRSTCSRRQVGAIAVRDKHILATGYNGASSGVQDCLELGCMRKDIPSGERIELCRAVHAEQNVIAQCALHGIALVGADIYCTHKPCYTCAKMLINCRVNRIIYINDYADNLGEEALKNANIKLIRNRDTDELSNYKMDS